MRVVMDTTRCCVSNIMHNLNRGLGFFQPETLSSECLLIDQRVKIGEASTEFDLLTIQRDAAVSALPFSLYLYWNVVDVNREEPWHSCFF